jgi:hypothetical protein
MNAQQIQIEPAPAQNVQPQSAAPAVRPAELKEVVPMVEVLRQVRRDSRREPQQYLEETMVPFGGE